ncbi:MAG: LLM class F420-dependent oxidoreductase [Chloroflexi bacterium]|nr:LLM class F420-dependent oxidoreductase [Chloroflexota bacterium]
MEFGIELRNVGPDVTPERLRAVAQGAEALGFHALWLSDHVVIPTAFTSRYPYARPGAFQVAQTENFYEVLSTLGWIAGLTTRIRLGTSVLVVPQRNPVLTAKQLATLDALSGGRLIVGVGVGWFREEFEALGASTFERRGAATDDYLRVFKAIWADETSSYDGSFYRLPPVRAFPKPVQRPHPPLWVGGTGPACWRRVAALGDGWHAIRPQRAALEEGCAAVRAEAERAGRDPATLALSVRVLLRWSEPPAPEAEVRDLIGDEASVAAQVRAYAALGVRHLGLDLGYGPFEEALPTLERFARLARSEGWWT